MADSLSVAVQTPCARPDRRPESRERPKQQPRYHVVLWNDEEHTYEYVVWMLRDLFGHSPEKGFLLAKQIDTQGRAVVLTTTLERAELKRDQIHAFGKDAFVTSCRGSMWATIETAE
ncbi:MAG: ATP-dependent Clp protease adaptor ClpS [Pirellulales bacterium]|nr:ATP-dependent Clp protease adaptor ClpS [Pirellulales bacterium]